MFARNSPDGREPRTSAWSTEIHSNLGLNEQKTSCLCTFFPWIHAGDSWERAQTLYVSFLRVVIDRWFRVCSPARSSWSLNRTPRTAPQTNAGNDVLSCIHHPGGWFLSPNGWKTRFSYLYLTFQWESSCVKKIHECNPLHSRLAIDMRNRKEISSPAYRSRRQALIVQCLTYGTRYNRFYNVDIAFSFGLWLKFMIQFRFSRRGRRNIEPHVLNAVQLCSN